MGNVQCHNAYDANGLQGTEMEIAGESRSSRPSHGNKEPIRSVRSKKSQQSISELADP